MQTKMDPIDNLRKQLSRRFHPSTLIPWVLVAVLAGLVLGIVLNERRQNRDQKVINDCVLSDWSPWQGCGLDNCLALAYRTRTVVQGSEQCTTQPLIETASCKDVLNCANPDCQYSIWSTWSDCPDLCYRDNASCDLVPDQIRFRTVVRAALPGGAQCDWGSLIERRLCAIQSACPPDVDCVASPSNPALDCDSCPDVGCTLTGQPLWKLCTRSIAVTQSGNGVGCDAAMLLYSITCDALPDCTEQCLSYDLDAFTRCTKPCGNGFYVSSTANSCPSVTSGTCSNGICPTGGWEVDPTNYSCSTATGFHCSATDALSFSQCLASAVGSVTFLTAWSVSDGVWFYTESANVVCDDQSGGPVYTYSNAAPCVEPSWDMVNAACMYLCDPNSTNFDAVARGIAFPFADGSISCPVDLALLSMSNVCPMVQSTPNLIDRPFGTSLWGSTSDATRDVIVDGLTYSLFCPQSTDCVYQSYSDALPWGVCTQTCAQGGGERSRNRVILAPSTFLGASCDPLLLTESLPCNQANSITSATEMWCQGAPQLSGVAEVACHVLCSETRNADPNAVTGSCNSIFLQSRSELSMQQSGGQIFLQTLSATMNSDQAFSHTLAFQTLVKVMTGDLTFRQARIEDLQAALGQGASACAAGWFSRTDMESADVPLSQTLVLEERGWSCGEEFFSGAFRFVLQGSIAYNCLYTTSFGSSTVEPATLSDCPVGRTPWDDPTFCSRTSELVCNESGTTLSLDSNSCVYTNELGAPLRGQEIGALVQLPGLCAAPLDQRGFHTFSDETTSSFFWWYSENKYKILAHSFPPQYLDLLPFFSHTGAASPLAPNYIFSPQTNREIFTCTLFPHRADLILQGSSCTSLSAAPPATQTLLDAQLLDLPCDLAQSCSLSDWVDVTSCSTCGPPYTYLQTRTVIRQATEGGTPCSNFVRVQEVPCPGVQPCVNPTTKSLCISQPARSVIDAQHANACDAFTESYAFLEEWSAAALYPWAALQDSLNTSISVLDRLRVMFDDQPLQPDLAVALNAQVAALGNAPPTCVPGVNGTSRALTGNTYLYSLSGDNPLGWFPESCGVDPEYQDALLFRVRSIYPSVSNRVFDSEEMNWVCPSTCPYILDSCDFSAAPGNSDCPCGVGQKSLIVRLRQWAASDGLTCSAASQPGTASIAQVITASCPNPLVPCASTSECPVGCDGTPCNYESGYGSCTLFTDPLPFYACSCSNASTALDCGIYCPRGPNGEFCSGEARGSCTDDLLCSCSAGFSGVACQHTGYAQTGALELLLRTANLSVSIQFPTETASTYAYTVTNFVPCYEEDNPLCNPLVFETADPALATFDIQYPLLYALNDDVALTASNICVNGGDAAIAGGDEFSRSWIPSYMLPYVPETQSKGCEQMDQYNGFQESFQYLAELTSESSLVPPSLWHRRFFLRCMSQSNAVAIGGPATIVRYQAPLQYDQSGKPIYRLVGYPEGTLFSQVCLQI